MPSLNMIFIHLLQGLLPPFCQNYDQKSQGWEDQEVIDDNRN